MSSRFEGWYFKQQSPDNMIAFIPAVHGGDGADCSSSLQIVTRDKSYFIELPYEAVSVVRRTLTVKAGDCVFSPRGAELNLAGR